MDPGPPVQTGPGAAKRSTWLPVWGADSSGAPCRALQQRRPTRRQGAASTVTTVARSYKSSSPCCTCDTTDTLMPHYPQCTSPARGPPFPLTEHQKWDTDSATIPRGHVSSEELKVQGGTGPSALCLFLQEQQQPDQTLELIQTFGGGWGGDDGSLGLGRGRGVCLCVLCEYVFYYFVLFPLRS